MPGRIHKQWEFCSFSHQNYAISRIVIHNQYVSLNHLARRRCLDLPWEEEHRYRGDRSVFYHSSDPTSSAIHAGMALLAP